jgi:DNA-binding NarL/FixJ family response regulator
MPIEIVAATLRLVMVGGTSFPAPAFWIRRLARRAQPDSDGARLHGSGGHLTLREEDVLKLVGEGVQNKIIAFRLHMSENTVKVHLHRILQKLNLHNRTEVALLAGSYFANAIPPAVAAPPAAESQLMAESPDRFGP